MKTPWVALIVGAFVLTAFRLTVYARTLRPLSQLAAAMQAVSKLW